MALLECPECGKKVSTEATACPGCGGPAPKSRKGETVTTEEAKKMTRNEKKAFLKAGGKVVLSKSQKVCSALLFALLLFGISKCNMNKSEPSAAVSGSDQLQHAKNQIEEAMKDPRKVRYLECQGINPWESKPNGWSPPSKKECAELDKVLGKEAQQRKKSDSNK